MTRITAAQTITTPAGETLVLLPLAEYEALVDAADITAADRVRADVAAGRDELVPSEIVDRLLSGENRVRVWRDHRGLSARKLAARAGISSGYLSEIESGTKSGAIATLRKIALALDLTIDDLL